MIRLTELKLRLDHSPADLTALVRKALALETTESATLHIFKRSIDARKAELLLVYIVDVDLPPERETALLAKFASHLHIGPTPDIAYQLVAHAPLDVPLRPAGKPTHPAENLLRPVEKPLRPVVQQTRPVVVGFGPCGIFAALLLAQMGFKPIVLERGKKVRERTQDTWGLWRKNVLNPESNVQFGEGGAGTFSDGKLWSQIKDPRHLGRKVMQEFVKAGAPPEILVDAHPHIGTFRLVGVVEHMRAQIIALGGEIRFEQRVTDVLIEQSSPDAQGRTRHIRALTVLDVAANTSYTLRADHVVLAVGHSARDTFAMLHARGVFMQAKPFSIGFRIEHPQGLIDRARWGRHAGHPLLGAAEYKLVHHVENGPAKGRSVYSFCMCPGGTVVAATSESGRVVTNGMSQYSRNERNANAGIVVGIEPRDYPTDAASFYAAFGDTSGDMSRYTLGDTFSGTFSGTISGTLGDAERPLPAEGVGYHPLAGIVLQRQLESNAYVLGGSSYEAPGQLVGDFLAGRASTALGSVQPSYQPGVKLGSLSTALPGYAIAAIRDAIPAFGKKIKGFDMADAVLTGVETRTSSPLKITRGEDFQSLNVAGLYPAGEGASYAGGILSAGVDGIRVAEALAHQICATPNSARTV